MNTNVPIKIIHKFKNNNRRIQYIQYIFIGSNVNEEIMNILEYIKNKTFFETIETLSKQKIDKLVDYYGENWYLSFFNRYHLSDQINAILKSPNKKKIAESKMGSDWVNKMSPNLLKKSAYSYASTYYDYLIARNKIKTMIRKVDMDFRTYKMTGGGPDGDDTDDEVDTDTDEINSDDEIGEETINNQEDLDDAVNDNFNLEELTMLYSKENEEDDKNIISTAQLISDATNNKSFVKNIDKIEIEFNEKIDNISYDMKLEDVYQKVYIKDQFIYKDDTIKTIRTKVSVSIPLSEKFEDAKLLPEYTYFWSEYKHDDKLDNVMIGQKWIRRNEMVMIDVKPNENLAVYENLRNNLSYLKDSFGIKLKREDD
jgi:hypothetical protein